jgi:hypothetical protein
MNEKKKIESWMGFLSEGAGIPRALRVLIVLTCLLFAPVLALIDRILRMRESGSEGR